MLIQRQVSGALVVYIVLIILTTSLVLPGFAAKSSDPYNSSKYLNAVIEFADNVLNGRR